MDREQERREDRRARVSIEAWWQGLAGRHGARVSDLSLGGCYIDTFGKADIGEFVAFALKLPDGNWLHLRGQVASSDPNIGFSVAFSYLTEEEQEALARLIES